MWGYIYVFFFFTLKTPKKIDLSSRKIFVSGFGAICWLFGGHGLV
jgi:hypothetical protein